MRVRPPVLVAIGAVAALTASVLAAAPASAAPIATNYTSICGPAAPGQATCFAMRRTDVHSTRTLAPNAITAGYSPATLKAAYKLPAGTTTATVAIVDAFDDPNVASDLAIYRAQYGLPACTTANGCFTKVNQTGSTTSLPAPDTDWAGEISLDVDMVSAICPTCHILLVEANSNNNTNLYAAEDYATAHAKYVSNSWGGGEYEAETVEDAHFNHPGVVITASTGDYGNGAQYPATSPYVVAVGGTSLTSSTNSRGWTESAWAGAGSGCSAYEPKPAFQAVTTGCAHRAEADVSAVADPNTGVAVYQTYGGSGWAEYGGTSAASPIVAATYALAGAPGSADTPASYPYARPGNLFDSTTGGNGSCGAPMCTAGTGWDGPTGLGTPNGTTAFTSAGIAVTNPGIQNTVINTSASLTLTASGGTGTYTWSESGLPSGLSLNSTTGVISGTPTTTGLYQVTVSATSGGLTGSATFNWAVNPTGGCESPGQKLGNPGFETGFAAPWTASSSVIDHSTSEPAHSGSWKAWLGGYGQRHTDTLSQTVSLPLGCAAYTLSFYLHIDSAESVNAAVYDTMTVQIGSTTLAVYSNEDQGSGYTLKSFNVSAFAGQTVTILFTGTEDASLQTSFVIDDTALTAS